MQPRATRRRGQRAGGTEQAGEEERRAALTIRVDFGAQGALGPGKVRLLELISKHGSISASVARFCACERASLRQGGHRRR